MTETQRNIKIYRAMLPGLKERIAAAAMLLAVSLSMVVSASFAWITLSRAPEVSMMATTVASNGNLEIALAHGTVVDEAKDRERPEEVALGDSSATEGQTLVGANITWGNLVNLSHESYGLEHISLRPAKLSENNQSRTPLYGVDYTLDGRITESSDYYRFASWDSSFGQNGGFIAGEGVQYGVRAISSMTMSNDAEQMEINQMGLALDEQMAATKDAYNVIIKSNPNTSGTHMNSLIKMLEKFVNDKASEVAKGKFPDNVTFNPSDYGTDVAGLQNLLIAFRDMLREESEVYRQLVNMHIFDITGAKTDFIPEADTANGEAKGEHIRIAGRTAEGRAELQQMGIPKDLVALLKAHVDDYDKIQKAIDGIESVLKPMVANGEKVYWDLSYMQYEKGKDVTAPKESFLDYYISDLVNIGKTYVGPVEDSYDIVSVATGTKMKGIYSLADMSDALAVMGAKPIEVEIGGGVLMNTEQRIGALLLNNNPPYGTSVTIKINVKMSGLAAIAASAINGNKTAAVRTSAGAVPLLSEQINIAKKLVPEPKSMISKDIYGFAIDLWARTNAEDTILTLEGMTIYEEEDATCTNINGEISTVYVATGKIPGENEGEVVDDVVDVYFLQGEVPKLDANGDPVMDANGQPVMVMEELVYDALGHGIIGIKKNMASEEGGSYTFRVKRVKIYKGYEGVNRVWQEMIDGGEIPQDSTTQGAGSCYVFYASPSEQPKILEMLQSFTIAFLDGSDNLVATAKLNTEEAFDINGKVTVPLKVITGVPYVDQIGSGGSVEEVNKMGIMAMPRNQATWLTAIVYLDGEQLGNENVLAAGSIEGRLNLQFGSSVAINSQKNEPLLQKYRTVSAVVEGNGAVDDGTSESPLVEYTYDNTAKTVTARVTIEGDQPTNVTAFFTRMVGQNQGTRMETKAFTKDGNNQWIATFDLTKPGEYRLNSVVADGTEYMLENRPGVKIKGQTVSSITCDPGEGSIMTSENYYDVKVSATIDAEAELQPKQVSILFSYGQNKTATANLVHDGNGYWTGMLHITESGNYVMTYLVMDGNQDPVDQQTSLFVRVGMKAEISCAGIWDAEGIPVADQDDTADSYTIMFEPQGNGAYTVEMRVKLRDVGGNEVDRLSGLKLVYPMDGNPDKKMDTDLIWTDSSDGGYYKAELPFKEAGTYQFGWMEIELDGVVSMITNAPVAAKVVAVPPDPPAIPDDPGRTVGYQYAPNGDATMSVVVYDSSAAKVLAKIVNTITGESTLVEVKSMSSGAATDGEHKTMEQYTFTVPKNEKNTSGLKSADGTIGYVADFSGKQDGIWVLEALYMQQVTDENENYYPGAKGEYLIFDLTDENIRTEVMQSVFTEFTRQGAPYNKEQSFSGAVLEAHTVSNVKFRISDWRGSMDHISNVKLVATHGGDSQNLGGYRVENANLGWNWDVSKEVLDTQTLQVAGTYSVNLSYDIKVNDTTISSAPATVLTYTVSTPANLRPTVGITGISHTVGGKVSVDKSVTAGGTHDDNITVPQWNATSATVYITCELKEGSCGSSDTHNYTRPSVSMTLTNIGNATKAELNFTCAQKSDVFIYDGSTQVTGYTWTANGQISRNIGRTQSATSKNAAETLTATELRLSRDGIICIFTLSTPITIVNPY